MVLKVGVPVIWTLEAPLKKLECMVFMEALLLVLV